MAELKPKLRRFVPSPRCKTCDYSILHKDFHNDLLNSTYFDENGWLSVTQVMRKHKVKMDYRNVQNHVQKHLAPIKRYNDEKVALLKKDDELPVGGEITEKELAKAIAIPDAQTMHEMALDDTIANFHKQLKEGRIKLTAQSGLQAIKIKADIEAKNKDRGLDFLKAFSAMGQSNGQE